jgi:hypothetical protein
LPIRRTDRISFAWRNNSATSHDRRPAFDATRSDGTGSVVDGRKIGMPQGGETAILDNWITKNLAVMPQPGTRFRWRR